MKNTISDYHFTLPKTNGILDQDDEYLMLENPETGEQEKIRFHDYERIFEFPGLYEKVFYETLECQSPSIVTGLLKETVEKEGDSMEDLRVLDLGAGNGMVAEELRNKGVPFVVGTDIIKSAKDAALRDRPDVYDDYRIIDFTNPAAKDMAILKGYEVNTLVTVAALGFDDIPPQAFINAFNVIENDGWVVFNIRDKFITSEGSGFKNVIEVLDDHNFDCKAEKLYCHRKSISGKNLNYKAFAGKKLKDIVL